jgi:hypothetical protein
MSTLTIRRVRELPDPIESSTVYLLSRGINNLEIIVTGNDPEETRHVLTHAELAQAIQGIQIPDGTGSLLPDPIALYTVEEGQTVYGLPASVISYTHTYLMVNGLRYQEGDDYVIEPNEDPFYPFKLTFLNNTFQLEPSDSLELYWYK